MSKKIHCEGCGRSEPIKEHGRGETIRECTFSEVGFDGRTVKADLCTRCSRELKHSYFGVPAGDIDPRLLEREALMGPPEMPLSIEGAVVDDTDPIFPASQPQ